MQASKISSKGWLRLSSSKIPHHSVTIIERFTKMVNTFRQTEIQNIIQQTQHQSHNFHHFPMSIINFCHLYIFLEAIILWIHPPVGSILPQGCWKFWNLYGAEGTRWLHGLQLAPKRIPDRDIELVKILVKGKCPKVPKIKIRVWCSVILDFGGYQSVSMTNIDKLHLWLDHHGTKQSLKLGPGCQNTVVTVADVWRSPPGIYETM